MAPTMAAVPPGGEGPRQPPIEADQAGPESRHQQQREHHAPLMAASAHNGDDRLVKEYPRKFGQQDSVSVGLSARTEARAARNSNKRRGPGAPQVMPSLAM